MIAGHDENRFHSSNRPVSQGKLEFISQVGHIANAAEDGGGFAFLDEINGQAHVFFHADARDVFQQGPDHRNPFGEREQLTFFGIDANRDDELVKEPHTATDDVEMSVGDRIKLAGENRDLFRGRRSYGASGHWTGIISEKGPGPNADLRVLDGICRRFTSEGPCRNLTGVLHRRTSSNGVVYYASANLEAIGVRHAFSTRIGGISPRPFDSLNLGNPNGFAVQDDYERIWANYARLLSCIGCPIEPPLRIHQVHGNEVAEVEIGKNFDTGCKADALVSRDSHRAISVRTADCVPILLSGADGRVVAAVHAGWRGIVAGIIPAAVKTMTAATNQPAATLLAAVGPCIGMDAFEVGPEVLAEFERALGSKAPARTLAGGKGHVDLRAAARLQLLASGIGERQIESTDRCTATHENEFFSHRRERGLTGRMAAVILANGPEHP
jgi:polyphenol oxidase